MNAHETIEPMLERFGQSVRLSISRPPAAAKDRGKLYVAKVLTGTGEERARGHGFTILEAILSLKTSQAKTGHPA